MAVSFAVSSVAESGEAHDKTQHYHQHTYDECYHSSLVDLIAVILLFCAIRFNFWKLRVFFDNNIRY